MKVAYVTSYDAQNVSNWSGTGFHIAQSLERQGADVAYVGSLRNQLNPVNIGRHLYEKYVRRKNDHPQRDPGFLDSFSAQAGKKLRSVDADIIFSPGGLVISHLDTPLPVAMWTDCTFASMLDYYPAFSNLSARSIRNGHDAERRAIQRCDLLLFSSDWAADSALRDYGADPSRVHVVPFGSNLSDALDAAELDKTIARRTEGLAGNRVKFLCVGVSWQRKGVDVAVKVVGKLVEAGINAELHVAGCQPDPGVQVPGFVKLLGFLDKNIPAQRDLLQEHFRTAHWFILPTRADCFGIVFCEASSQGLPCVATDTGGVNSAVVNDVNGHVFPPDAPPEAWADYLHAVIQDPQRYAGLCRSAYRDAQERLNWDVSGRKALALAADTVARRRSRKA